MILSSQDVVRRVRKLRRHRGLTQALLAERLNLKRTAYANLESGLRKDIGLDELIAICAALEVEPLVMLSLEPIVLDSA